MRIFVNKSYSTKEETVALEEKIKH